MTDLRKLAEMRRADDGGVLVHCRTLLDLLDKVDRLEAAEAELAKYQNRSHQDMIEMLDERDAALAELATVKGQLAGERHYSEAAGIEIDEAIRERDAALESLAVATDETIIRGKELDAALERARKAEADLNSLKEQRRELHLKLEAALERARKAEAEKEDTYAAGLEWAKRARTLDAEARTWKQRLNEEQARLREHIGRERERAVAAEADADRLWEHRHHLLGCDARKLKRNCTCGLDAVEAQHREAVAARPKEATDDREAIHPADRHYYEARTKEVGE